MTELEQSKQVVRKHPLARCEDCPLYEIGRFVPSKFPETSSDNNGIAVVGEAPGFKEAAWGEPFVGPSGKLLDTVLQHHDIKREETLLTNACLCRPPGNITPTKNAIEACKPRLLGELHDFDPTHILALGNTAAQSLLGVVSGITTTRVGPPKKSSLLPRALVVPTFHPAACLRQGDSFLSLVGDVAKIKNASTLQWEPPQFAVFDDFSTALLAIQQLDATTDELVIDIEAGIEKDVSFGHPNEYDLLCVGIGYAPNRAAVFGENALRDKEVREKLGNLLRSKKLIAHNGKFDLAALYPVFGALQLHFDTMLAHYCLDERPGHHGLKTLAVELLGAPQYDKEIHKYTQGGESYANIPRPLLYKYNAYDIACTYALYHLFQERLAQTEGLRGLHDFLIKAANQLMFLELNGIAIDRAYNLQLQDTYLSQIEVLETNIEGIIGRYLNPRSPKQIKEYLHSQGILTDKTDVEVLKKVQEKIDPESEAGKFISELLEHRRKAKVYGTYVKGIRKRMHRGRVHTTYLLHGSTSGRLASRNPNLQNIVREEEVRRQFAVSKPGNIFVHADYKQAEGRCIATFASDEYLRAIFEDPTQDIFEALGDSLYGSSFDKHNKAQRVRVKAYFYGLSYGREAYSISQEYKIPIREAKEGLEAFFDLIPATAAWQQSIKDKVLNGEDLITSFGRRRRFYLITDENKSNVLNEALSFMPQSTASDICLSALVRLRPMLRGLGFIRLTIHDALVVECAEERKDEVGELLKTVMVEAGEKFTDYVPFAVDLSYGKSWGDL